MENKEMKEKNIGKKLEDDDLEQVSGGGEYIDPDIAAELWVKYLDSITRTDYDAELEACLFSDWASEGFPYSKLEWYAHRAVEGRYFQDNNRF